jgi:hypothetical protein
MEAGCPGGWDPEARAEAPNPQRSPGMLSERRRIVNCSSLLRTDRSKFGPSWRLSGERRDQTVDQASELAAGIVFGLTSVTIKPPSLRLARKLQTGEEAFDRLHPAFSVPADRTHPIGHRDLQQREITLHLGIRVAVHDSRQNGPRVCFRSHSHSLIAAMVTVAW